MLTAKKDNKYLWIIWILSISIPLFIAILFFIPTETGLQNDWVSYIPHVNGFLNSVTAIVLICGFFFIKKGRIDYHKLCMLTAFALGSLFLILYVIYHSSAPSTVFGDLDGNGVLEEAERTLLGGIRTGYLVILLSHILLAIIVVPFVLLALFYALTGKFDKHKRIVKYTLPIWLYVSISGVVVYLMISPYYQ